MEKEIVSMYVFKMKFTLVKNEIRFDENVYKVLMMKDEDTETYKGEEDKDYTHEKLKIYLLKRDIIGRN